MRNDDFIGQQFCWFTGVVEDIADPEWMNRVKVRCHGYHDSDTTTLETKDLPWAIIMMPSTSQGIKGYGRTHELEKGSWVVGFFRDGISAQDPLVMGSVSTMTDNTIDIPSEASGADNYPNNKVYKSKAGHIIEIDNGVWHEAVAGVEFQAATVKGELVNATSESNELNPFLGNFGGPQGTNFAADTAAAAAEVHTETKDAVQAVDPILAHGTGETIRVTHAKGTVIEINDQNDISITNAGTSTITTTGNISVISKEGNIDATSTEGNINVTAATGLVNITSGADINILAKIRTRIG